MLGKRRLCWRRVLATVAAGVLSTSLPCVSPVSAQSKIEACDIWRSAASTEVTAAADRLKKFVLGLFTLQRADTSSVAGPSEGDLYFTNASNFSSKPKCFDDPARTPSRDAYLYYPMGLVIQKIGEANLRGEYWLVETEYGLKTFIRKGDLSPLESDRAYFFADTKKVAKGYCLGQSDQECTPDKYLANRYLDPQTRYAVAKLTDLTQLRYRDGQNYILKESDLPCGNLNVGIYSTHGTPLEWGRLNSCIDGNTPTVTDGSASPPPQRLDPALKVVIRSNYAEYFKRRIDGAALRFEHSIVQKIAPELASEKKCNEALTFRSQTEYEISGGVSTKLAFLEVGGEAAKKYLKSYEEVLGATTALYLQAYELNTELGQVDAGAAPIQVRYGCDAQHSAPQTAHEIRISGPSLGSNEDFVLGIKNVDKDQDQADVLAIVPEGKSGLFDQGYVFFVQGADDYFSVRDKLFGILRRQYRSEIQNLYDDPDDKLYFWRATDFFVHLIIATVGKPDPQT